MPIILAGGLLSVGGAAAFAAPLPPSLTTVESSAEDIVDFALAHDRGRLAATARVLKAAADGPVAAALRRSGVPSADVAELERRANRLARLAARGSFISAALAANAVSELMSVLYGRFQNRVPARILALDYLDREAQLRSLAGQPAKVAWAVRQLGPTWARVRPKVIAAGGSRQAAAYDRHVATMKRLGPEAARKVQAEAVRGLELVDQLERVFTR